jgi:hypothetical protein
MSFSAFERSMTKMLHGWIEYAAAHKEAYETAVGEDYVIGDEWQAIGHALLGLLNGELGRMDAGTVDRLIRDTFVQNGFTRDGQEIK